MERHVSIRDEASASAPKFRTLRERLHVLAELESWLERPMQWLGLVWLGIVIIDLIGPPNRLLERVAVGLWVFFLIDFVIRLALAPRKLQYLRHNLLVAFSLFVPALSIVRLTTAVPALRTARGLKFVRMIGSVNRTMVSLKTLTKHGGFQYVLLLKLAVIFLGAAGIYAF